MTVKAYTKEYESLTFFEKLVDLDELLEKKPFSKYSRHTIYKWVEQGMPHEKIRGRLFFDPLEAAHWMRRSR